MKIAVPVDDKRIDSTVCMSFGRTPYFLFYDTDTKEEVYVDNNASSAQGGAGIQAAQLLADAKCEALLTIRCGENAVDIFKAAQISVYKTQFLTAKENIAAFEQNKLSPLTQFQRGFGGRW